MDYLSTDETAAKWKVSLRYVQRLLHDGRIPDAKKYSGAWLIPEGAEKPSDRRVTRTYRQPRVFFTAMPYPKRGAADDAPVDERYRALAAADLAYRRGDTEPAKKYWRQTGVNDVTKLSAASLATAAALSSGDYALYYEIESYLKAESAAAASNEEKALLSLPSVLAAVSMSAVSATPEWLMKCDFSAFPKELTPFLLYLYAMHLRNIKDDASLLHTARTAVLLCSQETTFTWLDLYFTILCATASFGQGDEALASSYLTDALELAIPHGMIMPFADTFGSFGGMMKRLIIRCYPEQTAAIERLWSCSFKNWMRFHNEFTRGNITTVLTAQEYQAAHLIVTGKTYAEAAHYMNISVSRIKNILSDVYSKLYIGKRAQLGSFIV